MASTFTKNRIVTSLNDYNSELDTRRFGFPVAKINDPERLIDDEFHVIIDQSEFDLVISRVPMENLKLIEKMECRGFIMKDAQVTYSFDLQKFGVPSLPPNDFTIRPARSGDIDELRIVAGESFDGYGHYFANELLDRRACIEIYMDWIERSVLSKDIADIVFVAERKGEVAGFLSFKKDRKKGIDCGVGGMGAVKGKFRGHGVFKYLVANGLEWGKDENLGREEHNVLVTNYPVNRVFSSLGFSIIASHITFHKWVKRKGE